MFIQTENTPNPQTIKFLPGQTVMTDGTASFTNKEDAQTSPLAQALFKLDNIIGIFFGHDYISITKTPEAEWDTIKPHALTTIMEHFVSNQPLFLDSKGAQTSTTTHSTATDDDDPIVIQIKELIDTRVRPAVAEDGGDIIFHGFENGVVYLEMHGACAGCPSSTVTLKNGIENLLRHYVPEVDAVEAVEN